MSSEDTAAEDIAAGDIAAGTVATAGQPRAASRSGVGAKPPPLGAVLLGAVLLEIAPLRDVPPLVVPSAAPRSAPAAPEVSRPGAGGLPGAVGPVDAGSRRVATPVRTLVVWCPDWPVVAASAAAGLPAHQPAAVVAANRVVACSAVARAEGVRRGARRRDAQARCPELVLFEDDPARDARLFESVAAAVEELAPGIEVVRPGLVAVPVRGPASYFGGEETAAERLVDHVAAVAGVECQVGVADGLYAATLAARRGMVVPAGDSPRFLADLDIGELDQPGERASGGTASGGSGSGSRAELVDLLRRLGLRTLGAFARVPERDVASRFGGPAVVAHRLARGLAERPPARRQPPPELAVAEELDPPVDRVDAAAFAARALADRLYTGLAHRGLACTRLGIAASTARGEELARVWRCAEPLTPQGIADRVRWQLDGWLRGSSPADPRPSAGISFLRLVPEEVVDASALQLGLWHGEGQEHGEATDRAGRALVRVQGLLGPDGVLTATLVGGRGPADQVRLVPWGDGLPDEPAGTVRDQPWPGRLPPPSPATVLTEPVGARVLDAEGAQIGVTGRHRLTGVPRRVELGGAPARPVLGWAGPWPAVERWWDPDTSRRKARLQVVLDDGHRDGQQVQIAVLLARQGQRWVVEGVYD